ncbi:MAG TPA: N-acetyl-gamma-glutamyl-phosphate reductase [Terriglobia bacterium]|nr:N-acetyl-gamma-glutamyl-phosphate reductase [Terriglobia bacterium]
MMAVLENLVSGKAEGERSDRTSRVAVVGATGYAGLELILWLARHPRARVAKLISSGRQGSTSFPVEQSHPQLRGLGLPACTDLRLQDLGADQIDLAFLATPHEVSLELAPKLMAQGVRVIDLSAAFRLKDVRSYPRWYGFDHRAAGELAQAVYGMPELKSGAIRNARLVANPGCYPTSIILALAPLFEVGWVDRSAGIVCDSLSGVSGAGRSLRDDLQFEEVNENCRAYGFFGHRHFPEMLEALNLGEDLLTFVPHLVPLSRGILSTIHVRLIHRLKTANVVSLFKERYGEDGLVRIVPEGKVPDVRGVAHTPFADIGFVLDEPTGRLVIVSAIDNLGKGAATQAIQNMNLMLGHEETAGLR